MDEEQAAALIAATLAWAVRKADVPAIHKIRYEGNEVFFSNSFGKEVFRMTIMATD